ncbi:hypothetical protein [Vreelandella lionensis]|uniref:hypothetical protein n=1 Tax=Vreelandella lionensis TaxID=1144478 RepID=UPI0009F5FAA0|nr:hypothetical protein [Halomonas lionensis]
MEQWPSINHQLRQDWENEEPTIYPNRRWVKARHLFGESSPSPKLHMLAQLKQEGVNVECCEAEVLAMRHHIGEFESLRHNLQRMLSHSSSMPVTLSP